MALTRSYHKFYLDIGSCCVPNEVHYASIFQIGALLAEKTNILKRRECMTLGGKFETLATSPA